MTLGDKIVFRVRSTPKGCKVVKYDGLGLGSNLFTKHHLRYFYGEDAEEKAAEYAHKKSEQTENGHVVELGETF